MFGDISYQNQSSIRNNSFNHINDNVKQWNMRFLRNSRIRPQNIILFSNYFIFKYVMMQNAKVAQRSLKFHVFTL
jgi:hypothetical protein